jgi:hypothetical protein
MRGVPEYVLTAVYMPSAGLYLYWNSRDYYKFIYLYVHISCSFTYCNRFPVVCSLSAWRFLVPGNMWGRPEKGCRVPSELLSTYDAAVLIKVKIHSCIHTWTYSLLRKVTFYKAKSQLNQHVHSQRTTIADCQKSRENTASSLFCGFLNPWADWHSILFMHSYICLTHFIIINAYIYFSNKHGKKFIWTLSI